MSENKSDTLKQRKIAQQKFLELKKMQAGQLEPEAPPQEIKPKTFSEKRKNFWYHYKTHTILSLFMAVVLAVGITQCANRTKYDSRIVLYTENIYSNTQIDLLTNYMSKFFDDTNGDGEVNLQIIDCSYSTEGTFDSNYVNTMATKLQATIASEPEIQLFIVDQKRLKQLNEISAEVGDFIIDSAPLPASLNALKTDDGYTFPEGLIIGRRVLKGTILENNKKAISASESSKQILENIKNYK
ncbi:MAG: hypothetical protein IJP26_02775 [Clostridia bacterium]|nr:hypothetical protein [Clostridia bacterium]